jgi:hypothetical protein
MHNMEMIREHEGMQEWHCPACGRHVLVNWMPSFKRTILQAGDTKVSHNGFKADLQRGLGTVMSVHDKEIEKPLDESRLTPWKMWLDESDFDNLWNHDIQ